MLETALSCLSGASPLVAAAGVGDFAGQYFSVAKIITMLVLTIPWFYLAPMAHKDAVRVRAKAELWGITVLGAGIVGMLVWLLLPFFVVGLLIYLVLLGTALLSYVIYRNSRVPQEEKILTADHIRSLMAGRKHQKVEISNKLKLYERGNKVVLPPTTETAEPEQIRAYNLAQELLYDIIWRRASEAQLMPAGQNARVRYIIDGVVSERDPIPLDDSEMIIQYLKSIGGMDPDETRRPQQGNISVDLAANNPIDIELSTTGTTDGQQMSFRVVQEVVQTQLDTLGMTDEVLQKVRQLNRSPSGLLIVSGTKGSGITSTLYSLLREHDAFMNQIVTLEPSQAVDLENITQHEYGEPDRLAPELASALRRDPDVIMVDGCTDPRAMQMLQEAATSKMVLLGLQASDSFSALAKWVRGVGSAQAAMQVLLAVTNQRLLRKLCPTCREAYQPDPRLLAKINIKAQQVQQFYRPPTQPLTDEKGRPYTCPTCQGSAYFGRTAIFELLEITDELRQMVVNKASIAQVKAACRKNKMLYLQEQGLRKVIEGITSIQEVVRVTQQNKKRRKKA